MKKPTVIKPVLLGYQKKFGRHKTAYPHVEVTCTGNVMLQIDLETIQKFAIPTIPLYLMQETKVKTYSYVRINKKVVKVPTYYRYALSTKSTYNVVRLHFLSKSAKSRQKYEPKSYSIRFPYFFNRHMISSALASMLAKAPNKERIVARIDKRRRELLIANLPSKYQYMGKAFLATRRIVARNLHLTGWPDLCLVKPVIHRARKKLTKV